MASIMNTSADRGPRHWSAARPHRSHLAHGWGGGRWIFELVFEQVFELATRLELVTCCFSAASIGGLWPGGIVWRLA